MLVRVPSVYNAVLKFKGTPKINIKKATLSTR